MDLAADTTTRIHQQAEFFYLKVKLEFGGSNQPNYTDIALKQMILASLQSLFGEVGEAIRVDILKYDEVLREMILRVSANKISHLWSALTLWQGRGPSVFRIEQISGSLLGLAANSRSYDFIQQAS